MYKSISRYKWEMREQCHPSSQRSFVWAQISVHSQQNAGASMAEGLGRICILRHTEAKNHFPQTPLRNFQSKVHPVHAFMLPSLQSLKSWGLSPGVPLGPLPNHPAQVQVPRWILPRGGRQMDTCLWARRQTQMTLRGHCPPTVKWYSARSCASLISIQQHAIRLKKQFLGQATAPGSLCTNALPRTQTSHWVTCLHALTECSKFLLCFEEGCTGKLPPSSFCC